MRLRFYKEHGEFYQYFLDKFVVEDVPVMTFSTEEEQEAFLTADARKPIRHLKGEDFRIIFFNSFDGRYGIYINVTHLCMDAARCLCSSPICLRSMTISRTASPCRARSANTKRR